MSTNSEPEVNLSEQVARFLVAAIELSVGDDIKGDVQSNRLVTQNSTPFRIWDFINKNVINNAPSAGCLSITSQRGPWVMSIIYDPNSKNIVTLMREERFSEVQRQNGDSKMMHYLEAFAKHLNPELKSPQLSLFEQPADTRVDEARRIVQKMLNPFALSDDSFGHHVLVLFSSAGYQVTNIRAVLVDKHLDIVCSENLTKYITADDSVIIEPVNVADEAYNKPTHGLKFTGKTIERQKRAQLKKEAEEDKA